MKRIPLYLFTAAIVTAGMSTGSALMAYSAVRTPALHDVTAVSGYTDDMEPAEAGYPEQSSRADGTSVCGTEESARKVRKVLLVGDSMTGWMGERLEAYGRQNGFEVATVVWDGSTIPQWGKSSGRLSEIVADENPDVVMVSLGLNELLERNPATRFSDSVDRIVEAVGDIPLIWVGPPSWPGKGDGGRLNDWLESKIGAERFFRSSGLSLARQSATNPHPSREGISQWVDSLVEWLPSDREIEFPGLEKPQGTQMVRGKTFIYRKMKDNL